MIHIVNKDQGIGWLLFIICTITAIAYIVALFIPAIVSIRCARASEDFQTYLHALLGNDTLKKYQNPTAWRGSLYQTT